MKKIIVLFAILTSLVLQTNAKIWRVNNNTGVQADFTTITAAITAAAAGDSIYIEGSTTQYSGSTVAKPLTFIGTGYYLTDASNTKTQWNTNASVVQGFTFNAGSKGSKVSGVDIEGAVFLNDIMITIERCRITSYLYFANSANTYADYDTIRQCVVYGLISQTSTGSAKGLMIYNNIITGYFTFSNLTNTTAYFINNDFISSNSVMSENCVFQNNIFYNYNFGSYGTSNYLANNIFGNSSASSGVPAGNNNQFSIDMNSVYSAWHNNIDAPPAGYSHDNSYMLASGSPAIGAGNINSVTVDCGAFGGPAPYILSGMPNIPSIYALTVPAQVNKGTATINISLSAAAH